MMYWANSYIHRLNVSGVSTAATHVVFAISVCILCLAAIYFPVLTVISCAILFTLLLCDSRTAFYFTALIIIAIFTWLNIEKVPVNDWSWYTTHYRWMADMDSFSEYFQGVPGLVQPKVTEPAYHLMAFTLSKLTDGYVPALAVVVTTVVYGCVAAVIGLFFSNAVKSPWQAFLIVWVALLVGVTFTLTAQLVRQEISASLMLLGFALIWRSRLKFGFFMLILAGLTHNSVVIPMFCVLFCWCSGKFLFRNGYRYLHWLCLILFGVGLGLLFLYSSYGVDYEHSQKNDGEISQAVYLMDVLLLIGMIVLRRKLSDFDRLIDVLLGLVVLYITFIIMISHLPLPLLRMYFYVDFFRVLVLGLLVLGLTRTIWSGVYFVPFSLGAIAYVELRILASPFYFYGTFFSKVLKPLGFFYL